MSTKKINLGDTLTFQFTISSKKNRVQKLVVDYAIIYPRSGGGTSRKIFKLKEFLLGPGEKQLLSKKQLFRNFSTRVHYSGMHTIELLINGAKRGTASFDLEVPSNKLVGSNP